jgi:zinc/manganese transport system permease protein
VFTTGAAASIGLLGEESGEHDLAIGIMYTLALGLGVLFLSLYPGYAEGVYALLFGDVLGISRADVRLTAALGLIILLAVAAVYRPLSFSTFDPGVAEARGVPVRALALGFLLLVAIDISISVQVVGVLLVFTLLVGPAATAMRLVRGPGRTIALAMVLGTCYIWLGLFLAIHVAHGTWPPSFFIAAISFAVYMPARLLSR